MPIDEVMGLMLGVPGAQGGARVDYTAFVRSLFGVDSIVEYWPQDEGEGTAITGAVHQRNGTYVNVSRNGTEFLDGSPAPYFDGTAYGNVYSASLRDAFNGQEGTLWAWVKVSAGFWTDGLGHTFANLGVDGNDNYLRLEKPTQNNSLRAAYRAGAVSATITLSNASTTDWFLFVLTWSKSGNIARAYVNGSKAGEVTPVGTWTTSALDANRCVLGAAYTIPTNSPHLGFLGPVGLLNRPATEDEIARLYARGIEPLAPAWDTVAALGAYRLHDMTGDTLVASLGSTLAASQDGVTWTPVQSFPAHISACRVAGDGSLIVWLVNGTVYRGSLSGGDFTPVLTLTNPEAYPASSYGTFVQGGMVGFGEYSGGTAQYAYLSEDNGATWRTVFELPLPANPAHNHHIHNIAYDPYDDVLWIVTGDGDNRNIYYSEDLGTNWNALGAMGWAGGNMIQIVPLADRILFLTDATITAVYAIMRGAGPYTYADLTLVWKAWPIPTPSDTPVAAQPLVHDGRVYLSFFYSNAGHVGLGDIYATADGATVAKVARAKVRPTGTPYFGTRKIVGPDSAGYLYADTLPGDGGSTLVRFRPVT